MIQSHKMQTTVENIQAKTKYGFYTETKCATEMWSNIIKLVEYCNSSNKLKKNLFPCYESRTYYQTFQNERAFFLGGRLKFFRGGQQYNNLTIKHNDFLSHFLF